MLSRKEGKRGMETKSGILLPKMLPGAVCAQMIRCGKPNCKCAQGDLHGPYFYHFTRNDGVLVKRYIKAKDVAQVRAACNARRAEEKQQRKLRRLSARQLITILERIRESEELLNKLMEMRHAQTRQGKEEGKGGDT